MKGNRTNQVYNGPRPGKLIQQFYQSVNTFWAKDFFVVAKNIYALCITFLMEKYLGKKNLD